MDHTSVEFVVAAAPNAGVNVNVKGTPPTVVAPLVPTSAPVAGVMASTVIFLELIATKLGIPLLPNVTQPASNEELP